MAINLEAKLTRNPELIASEIDGETVMMSIETGKYFGLDPVGGKIWNYLEEPHSVNDLISNLVKSYEVSEEQCREDTLPFLEELVEKSVLKIS